MTAAGPPEVPEGPEVPELPGTSDGEAAAPAGPITVRRIREEEWREARALRLEALQDPAAALAFLETHDQALARPDGFWQGRAADACDGSQRLQVVAVTTDGRFVGTASGLLEVPGTEDFAGVRVEHRQVHVVGVYVAPGHRGRDVLARLVEAVASWAETTGTRRVRLYVHEDNARARAAYAKLGFVPTGATAEVPAGTEVEMVLEG